LWGIGYNEVWDTPSSKADESMGVASPSFTVDGFTTDERFYEACEDEQIMDGLLNRFMSFEDLSRAKYVEVDPERAKLPEKLQAQLSKLNAYNVLDAISDQGVVPNKRLRWGKGAEEIFVHLREKRDEETDRAKRELSERMPEMAVRIGTIIAGGCFNPVLERGYMEIAMEDVLASVARMSKGVIEDGAAKAVWHHGEMARRILKFVKAEWGKQVEAARKHGEAPEGIGKSTITRQFNPHAKFGKDVDTALASLLGELTKEGDREGGLLIEGVVKTKGRSRTVYWPAKD
jgi:hypothetical protein